MAAPVGARSRGMGVVRGVMSGRCRQCTLDKVRMV